jgi:hypothetical protein
MNVFKNSAVLYALSVLNFFAYTKTMREETSQDKKFNTLNAYKTAEFLKTFIASDVIVGHTVRYATGLHGCPCI